MKTLSRNRVSRHTKQRAIRIPHELDALIAEDARRVGGTWTEAALRRMRGGVNWEEFDQRVLLLYRQMPLARALVEARREMGLDS